MKLIKYTLTPQGTVPDYVVDGGYFPVLNNKTSPQNLDLVGVALDSATEESFANEAELLTFLQEQGYEYKNLYTEEITPLETVAAYTWSKLG